MSELRSAIEPYRREVLAGLPDARLEEDFAELQRAAEQIEAEALRRLAEIERRRCFETDGYLSAAAWLASRFGLGWGGARQAVHLARSLEQMPAARRAMEDGEISLQAVRILAQARETKPRGVRALGSPPRGGSQGPPRRSVPDRRLLAAGRRARGARSVR